MLKQLLGLIKIKLLTSRFFHLFTWFGVKEQGLAINPTLNLNLVGTLTDRNGFTSERGLRVETEKVDIMHQVFWDIFLTLKKCKGNAKKEQALLNHLPKEVMELLTSLDLVVKKEQAPKVMKFSNPLDVASAKKVENGGQENLQLNPQLYIQQSSSIPKEVSQYFANTFKAQESYLEDVFDCSGPVVWSIDPVSGFVLPVGLQPAQLEKLKVAMKGGDLYDCFCELEIAQLKDCSIVYDESELAQAKASFNERLEASKQQLKTRHYTVFKSPFSDSQINAHRRYFATMARSGFMKPNCLQVPNRKFLNNEVFCRFLHFQINALVAKITAQDIKPSYSFLARYLPGAILEKHIDRAQCEWNASMPLDVNNAFDKAWPIYLQIDKDDKDSVVEIALDLGDMVIYSGNKLYHWREMLEQDKESSICFFHFVDENFTGSLN